MHLKAIKKVHHTQVGSLQFCSHSCTIHKINVYGSKNSQALFKTLVMTSVSQKKSMLSLLRFCILSTDCRVCSFFCHTPCFVLILVWLPMKKKQHHAFRRKVFPPGMNQKVLVLWGRGRKDLKDLIFKTQQHNICLKRREQFVSTDASLLNFSFPGKSQIKVTLFIVVLFL